MRVGCGLALDVPCSVVSHASDPQSAAEPSFVGAGQAASPLVRTMLEALPVPVSWAEADGCIAFWNRRAEELFGYSSADVPSVADWYRLAYPDDAYRAEVVRGWEQAISRAR